MKRIVLVCVVAILCFSCRENDDLTTPAGNKEATEKDGRIPLHHITFNGKTEIVKAFLDNGVDLNARNKFNETALFFSC